MAVTGFIILLILSIIGYYTEKHIIINPITVFCGLWALILLFSSLGYYTMYPAEEKTYSMILIGSLFYVFGFYINKVFLNSIHLKIGRHTRYYKDINYYAFPRYTLLYILTILCICFSLYDFINFIRQAGFGSMEMVQAFLQSGEYENNYNPIMSALLVLVVSPVGFAIPSITAVDFWFGKRDKKLLILTAILLVFKMLSSANRTTLVIFFIFLILTAILYIYQNKKTYNSIRGKFGSNKKVKRYIFIIGIIGIIAFVIMSMSRGSALFRNLYLNFAMPPRMFEIWAETIDANKVMGYGITSLLGFIYPVCYFIKNLLGLDSLPITVQEIFDWTMLTDTQWVWPGKNILANAYVSIFWFFYTDGRQIGIIIGMFLFGIVVSKSYQNVVGTRFSARQIASYCIIFYGILFSFVRFQFTLYKYALALVFVMFFAYKMVPKETEKNNENTFY